MDTAEQKPLPPDAAQPMSLAEAAQLRFLDAGKLRFFQVGATLRLTIEAEASWLRVTVFRAFPLSLPDRFLSVRDGDSKEIGILADPAQLDDASRKLVDAELERRYMLSVIHRVLAVKERFGTVEWEVETSRGRRRFTTRDLRENVVRTGGGHYLLTDVESNRYEVSNLGALDAQSQEWLLRHL